MVVIIGNGVVRHIYDDDYVEADARIGNVISIERASHVEPRGSQWVADMSPVGGPVLGPFAKRGQALACEVYWLEANNLPKN